jgi:16S rRNA C967 or C1407 C5-methylase (RsmB/RsmF family)
MAEMMKNTGRIIANDINDKRLRALFGNLERLGIINVSVTKYDGRKFPRIVEFPKVLVDVPCSGEGRSFKEKPVWVSKKLWRKQFKLLENAVKLARVDGEIIYSTCTLSPLENEFVVSKILERFDNLKLEKIKLRGIKFEKGVTKWLKYEFSKEVSKCARFYPHISGTGGFFVAKFRKY